MRVDVPRIQLIGSDDAHDDNEQAQIAANVGQQASQATSSQLNQASLRPNEDHTGTSEREPALMDSDLPPTNEEISIYMRDLTRLWTFEEALTQRRDMTIALMEWGHRNQFLDEVIDQHETISELVSEHLLGHRFHKTRISAFGPFYHDEFDLSVKIELLDPSSSKSMVVKLKIISHFCGEKYFPGNVEEEVRCEAATYIYMQKNCSDISIPTLLGFGVPGGTSLKSLPLLSRIKWHLRDFWACLWGLPSPAPFVMRQRKSVLSHGYLLYEWIDGQKLKVIDETDFGEATPVQRTNFHRGIARIMLSLARIPQPRIGSWTVADEGVIKLSNRPLDASLHRFEAYNMPTMIPRSKTFESVNDYYMALLNLHDLKLEWQPNAIKSEYGAKKDIAEILLARSIMPSMTAHSRNYGPFVMLMARPNLESFLVDDAWNIKHMLNLRWICSSPIEAFQLDAELWLIPEEQNKNSPESKQLREDLLLNFERVLEQEEKQQVAHDGMPWSKITLRSRKLDHDWYYEKVRDPGFLTKFLARRFPGQPKPDDPDSSYNTTLQQIARLLRIGNVGHETFIRARLAALSDYEQSLRDLFGKFGFALNAQQYQEYMDNIEPEFTGHFFTDLA